MEPLERLLNLVGLLLETRSPLTFDQIRETLEPYRQERVETAKRMFERDKDVLREYGVPIELVDTDAWGTEQGYLIPKERYYLPEIAFAAEELAALLVAAQSGGDNAPAEHAARKLLSAADGGVLSRLAGGPLASGSDARSALVVAAADAAQGRRRVRFGYRTSQGQASERRVDAYAMVFRGGHWYLVGHDLERDAIRAFRLSRVTTDLAVEGEGSEPPETFRAAEHVHAGPWASAPHERAVIAFAPRVAWWVAASLVGAETGPTDTDGWVDVRVPLGDENALAALVLEFGPDAIVRSPAALRDEIRRRLERILERVVA
jgi:proteasome accessory factor B